MQAGDVIWLLAGIGIGLTLAMLILAGVLVADGQRFKRRLTLASDAATEPRPARAPKGSVLLAGSRPSAEAKSRPAPPTPPAPPIREPIVVDAKAVEPAAAVVEEMMSDLAAEIARVQTVEPVTVDVPAAPEPVRVVAEPAALPPPSPPAPLPPPVPAAPAVTEKAAAPVVAAPAPAPPVAPLVAAPVIEPAPAPPPPPKVPALPKVTPARKFAPALPPRNPPPKT